MLWALLRQCLCAMCWMDGREIPIIFSAVLTTLCSDFLSEAVELPNQVEIQLVSTFSIVPQKSGQDGMRQLCSPHLAQEVQQLLSPFDQ